MVMIHNTHHCSYYYVTALIDVKIIVGVLGSATATHLNVCLLLPLAGLI